MTTDDDQDRAACDCRPGTGFHQPSCAAIRPAPGDGDDRVSWLGCGCWMEEATGRMYIECADHVGREAAMLAAERERVLAPVRALAEEMSRSTRAADEWAGRLRAVLPPQPEEPQP